MFTNSDSQNSWISLDHSKKQLHSFNLSPLRDLQPKDPEPQINLFDKLISISLKQTQSSEEKQPDQMPTTKIINNSPLKNCLALWKTAQFVFLKKQGICIDSYEVLVDFKDKKGAAKNDFLKVYAIKGLQGVWLKMFKKKFLYHYLMTSRAKSKQKIIFQREIARLESAFQLGRFK